MTALSAPLRRLSFSALPDWPGSGLSLSFAAFARSAGEMMAQGRGFSRETRFSGEAGDWRPACEAALARNAPDEDAARAFFERHFLPVEVSEAGFLTGYYEAEAMGSLAPDPAFPVPVYGKPDELVRFTPAEEERLGRRYGKYVNGMPQPFLSRAEIEAGGLPGGRVLVWLSSWVDAFFIHIQGSGRVRLADGSVLRLAYAGKNGAPYTPIGRHFIEAGLATPATMSMQFLRQWLVQNPREGLAIMRRNESYIFFREAPITDPELGPPGAEQVQLTAWRSLAVDRAFWAFGTPLWLSTQMDGQPFRQLMVAQDTGSAIRGIARADVFCGHGEQAARIAGGLKSPARLVALLPMPLVERLA